MHSIIVRKSIMGVLAAFLIAFLGISPALGQNAETTPSSNTDASLKAFEFYPTQTGYGSFFDPTIKAGASATLSAVIANTGKVAQDIRTYPNNAFTAENGGFAAAEYGTPPNDVTSWLNYPEESYSIEPGKGVQFEFSIAVPEGTAPGQYLTSIAAEQAELNEVPNSENFKQRLRFLIPVFITVPGKTIAGFEAGEIEISVDSDALAIRVDHTNTGDVRVRPEGMIELLNQNDQLIVSFPVKMQSIYAHDSTTLTVGAAGVTVPGPYKVRVNLSDAETGTTATAEKSDLVADLAATPVPVLISITSAAATPKPAADNVQFVQVEATIQNSGDPVANAQLSLVASKDGVEVERFPISQSLSLPTGNTPISTRYLPADGWTSGTWTFELLLESVDPSGAAVVLSRLPVDGTVTIP